MSKSSRFDPRGYSKSQSPYYNLPSQPQPEEAAKLAKDESQVYNQNYYYDSDDSDSDQDTVVPEKDSKVQRTGSIKCSYADCNERFSSISEMKLHKKIEPEHHYCKKCDVDCEDWEAMIQHKVDSMAPWLEHRATKGKSPPHIVCEFCGMDFKSFGGRRVHRENEHKGDHEVDCPGCGMHFMKAAEMVYHLEEGKCSEISAEEFMARIQQKRALAQIMKAPEVFRQNLAENLNSIMYQLPISKKKLAQLTDGAETLDQELGGVSLLDTEHENQKKGVEPLSPEQNLIELNLPLTRQNLESWPRLPGQKPSQAPKSSTSLSEFGDSMSDVTSRRGGRKILTDELQSPLTPLTSPSEYDYQEIPLGTDAKDMSETGSVAGNPGIWSGANTTKRLFKNAPLTPLTDQGVIIQHQKEALAAHNNTSGDIWTSRFWNPVSADYNYKLFYRFDNVTQSGKYHCPFPNCADCQWEHPAELEIHLRLAHLNSAFVCSQCLKRFKSAARLMGHIEDTRKCAITESDNFKRLVGEITGDFLKADNIIQPKILVRNKETALVKGDQYNTGVTNVKFKAQMPRW